MLNVRKTLGKLLKRQAALLPSDTTFVEQKTLLWTNPSQTTSFAAQTINSSSSGWVGPSDLSKYNVFEIRFRFKSDNGQYYFRKANKESTCTDAMIVNTRCFRKFKPSNSGIEFFDAEYATYDTTSSVNNAYAIPVNIFGIKRIYGGA